MKVQEQVADALSWARHLNTREPSTETLDKGILMLDEVLQHREPGWQPRENEAVLECCDAQKKYTMLLNEGQSRSQRLAAIGRWKLRRRHLLRSHREFERVTVF